MPHSQHPRCSSRRAAANRGEGCVQRRTCWQIQHPTPAVLCISWRECFATDNRECVAAGVCTHLVSNLAVPNLTAELNEARIVTEFRRDLTTTPQHSSAHMCPNPDSQRCAQPTHPNTCSHARHTWVWLGLGVGLGLCVCVWCGGGTSGQKPRIQGIPVWY